MIKLNKCTNRAVRLKHPLPMSCDVYEVSRRLIVLIIGLIRCAKMWHTRQQDRMISELNGVGATETPVRIKSRCFCLNGEQITWRILVPTPSLLHLTYSAWRILIRDATCQQKVQQQITTNCFFFLTLTCNKKINEISNPTCQQNVKQQIPKNDFPPAF